ncbi:adenylate/guanylate cyclase domain-containing protein [Chachezhania sediminis]|uniref:adenylate/guanylate cyclase domain-containing protein n=1 Tax=Chachezhania sediminis TaxID=2599291 RepID=UPI00131C917E|nr:adenylate/guanylate cyclase domain-containing protein [Chachezhania sediminis]
MTAPETQPEEGARLRRKLTTILAADAARFSEHMGRDEVGTYAALHAARDVFDRLIQRHDGRIANTAGDGLIADFPSVVEAVNCAVEVQRELADLAGQDDKRLDFRIGIHLGDVIVDGDDLLGEGVNLAARLQEMAEPGGILISRQVYDQVRSKLSVGFEAMGDRRPKNFVEDVEVFRVSSGPASVAPKVAPVAQGGDADRTPPLGVADMHSHTMRHGHDHDHDHDVRDPGGLTPRDQFFRKVRMTGIGLAGLFLIDLFTGGSFFIQWVIVAAFLGLGMMGANVLTVDPIQARRLRFVVIGLGVSAINLLSWSGSFWAVFPLIGLAVSEGFATFGRKSGGRGGDLSPRD